MACMADGRDRADPQLLRDRRGQHLSRLPALPAHARRAAAGQIPRGNRPGASYPRKIARPALVGILEALGAGPGLNGLTAPPRTRLVSSAGFGASAASFVVERAPKLNSPRCSR